MKYTITGETPFEFSAPRFFYRFKADGRLRLDAGAGRLRTEDGQRYNLPVIQSSLPSNSRKPTAHTIGKNL